MEDIPISNTEFNLLRDLIYKVCGISLADTKKQMVHSRLRKRLHALQFHSFLAYYNHLLEDSSELTNFVNCITTNKTDFFRESHHFQYVRNVILPHYISQANHGLIEKKLRVWHAGCSTGEEPYTMAMVLRDTLRSCGAWDVRLLASDIDTNVLDTATEGVYEEEKVATVPQQYLNKYFIRTNNGGHKQHAITGDIKEMIKFRRINLLEDAWPIRADVRFDIIFCRNVIIYFDHESRCRLFDKFSRILKPGGYLFIGHSESLFGVSDAYTSLGQTIYQLPPHQYGKIAA